ncbi:interferon-induced protein 44-like [Lingula anatina]|uniref:Interferon-induced protein 44-like n=1 Tax=Lingula anatina TaxID=7574 RepID=A0A1S3IC33_LINAN|nr:interferon-induced protein 44-like [Lingula anatina]|eukprot:XP_013395802.1 interferon-induced protein 44-like [Lingula anatina]
MADAADSELPNAWRKCHGWDGESVKALANRVLQYEPPYGVKRARILLTGTVGSGKSSFFNGVKSVFRNRIATQAMTGASARSLTTKFRTYEIRATDGTPLKFQLCDTPGLEDGQGLEPVDFQFLLDGNVPDGFQCHPNTRITTNIPGFVKTPNISNSIHCLAFVIDAATVSVISETIKKKLVDIKDLALSKNIPCLILLTKVDKVSQIADVDLSKVYLSKALQDKVKQVADLLGLPESQVLLVKNYCKEVELDASVDVLTLTAIQRMLGCADDYFDELASQQCSDNFENVQLGLQAI